MQGFGRACGNKRAVVPMNESYQKLILQLHNGFRSLVASGLLKGYHDILPPAKRMGYIVSILLLKAVNRSKETHRHTCNENIFYFKQWDAELAKLAAINAKQCRLHYDKCRKTGNVIIVYFGQ